MNAPPVTVLMPMYNASSHLFVSLQSILVQTYGNFEVVIVNDCSTDDSVEIVRSFADPRIRVIHNDRNEGVAASLNKGLSFSRGKFVVRMDADDISHPERIQKQVAFMEEHPEVGISGTWVETIGDQAGHQWKHETNPEKIPAKLFFYCCLAHPSVIMRKDLLDKHRLKYSQIHPHAEDWELWIRASFCFRIANLPEVLLQYRISASSITRSNINSHRETIAGIHRENLARLGLLPDEDQLRLHHAICECNYQHDADFFAEAYRWLQNVNKANRKHHLYNEREFEEVISEKIIDISPFRAAFRLRVWGALARLIIRRVKPAGPLMRKADQ